MIKAILSDFFRVLYLPQTGLNTELLDYYSKIKQKYNLKLYIFTNSRITHTDLNIFEKIFFSNPFTFSKHNPDSYLKIARELNISPEETLFIDDQSSNIEAAKSVGLKTIKYSDNKILKREIENNFA